MFIQVLLLLLVINTRYGINYSPNKENYKLRAPYGPLSYRLLTARHRPQYPVCGFLRGVWKTFSNLNEFRKQQFIGHNWKFYGYGNCPSPVNFNNNTAICGRFRNEIRKFNNILALQLEKLHTRLNWTIVHCPITKETVCATSSSEKRLFRDSLVFNLVKFVTKQDWVIVPCPDLTTPFCFKLDDNAGYAQNNTQEHIPSWIIIPCDSYEATVKTKYKKTMNTTTTVSTYNIFTTTNKSETSSRQTTDARRVETSTGVTATRNTTTMQSKSVHKTTQEGGGAVIIKSTTEQETKTNPTTELIREVTKMPKTGTKESFTIKSTTSTEVATTGNTDKTESKTREENKTEFITAETTNTTEPTTQVEETSAEASKELFTAAAMIEEATTKPTETEIVITSTNTNETSVNLKITKKTTLPNTNRMITTSKNNEKTKLTTQTTIEIPTSTSNHETRSIIEEANPTPTTYKINENQSIELATTPIIYTAKSSFKEEISADLAVEDTTTTSTTLKMGEISSTTFEKGQDLTGKTTPKVRTTKVATTQTADEIIEEETTAEIKTTDTRPTAINYKEATNTATSVTITEATIDEREKATEKPFISTSTNRAIDSTTEEAKYEIVTTNSGTDSTNNEKTTTGPLAEHKTISSGETIEAGITNELLRTTPLIAEAKTIREIISTQMATELKAETMAELITGTLHHTMEMVSEEETTEFQTTNATEENMLIEDSTNKEVDITTISIFETKDEEVNTKVKITEAEKTTKFRTTKISTGETRHMDATENLGEVENTTESVTIEFSKVPTTKLGQPTSVEPSSDIRAASATETTASERTLEPTATTITTISTTDMELEETTAHLSATPAKFPPTEEDNTTNFKATDIGISSSSSSIRATMRENSTTDTITTEVTTKRSTDRTEISIEEENTPEAAIVEDLTVTFDESIETTSKLELAAETTPTARREILTTATAPKRSTKQEEITAKNCETTIRLATAKAIATTSTDTIKEETMTQLTTKEIATTVDASATEIKVTQVTTTLSAGATDDLTEKTSKTSAAGISEAELTTKKLTMKNDSTLMTTTSETIASTTKLEKTTESTLVEVVTVSTSESSNLTITEVLTSEVPFSEPRESTTATKMAAVPAKETIGAASEENATIKGTITASSITDEVKEETTKDLTTTRTGKENGPSTTSTTDYTGAIIDHQIRTTLATTKMSTLRNTDANTDATATIDNNTILTTVGNKDSVKEELAQVSEDEVVSATTDSTIPQVSTTGISITPTTKLKASAVEEGLTEVATTSNTKAVIGIAGTSEFIIAEEEDLIELTTASEASTEGETSTKSATTKESSPEALMIQTSATPEFTIELTFDETSTKTKLEKTTKSATTVVKITKIKDSTEHTKIEKETTVKVAPTSTTDNKSAAEETIIEVTTARSIDATKDFTSVETTAEITSKEVLTISTTELGGFAEEQESLMEITGTSNTETKELKLDAEFTTMHTTTPSALIKEEEVEKAIIRATATALTAGGIIEKDTTANMKTTLKVPTTMIVYATEYKTGTNTTADVATTPVTDNTKAATPHHITVKLTITKTTEKPEDTTKKESTKGVAPTTRGTGTKEFANKETAMELTSKKIQTTQINTTVAPTAPPTTSAKYKYIQPQPTTTSTIHTTVAKTTPTTCANKCVTEQQTTTPTTHKIKATTTKEPTDRAQVKTSVFPNPINIFIQIFRNQFSNVFNGPYIQGHLFHNSNITMNF